MSPRKLSYLERAMVALSIGMASLSQSRRFGGNFPSWYLTGMMPSFPVDDCLA